MGVIGHNYRLPGLVEMTQVIMDLEVGIYTINYTIIHVVCYHAC